MNVEFYNYHENDTDVHVAQKTMSLSTFHIAVENDEVGESIIIYMPPDKVQGFIDKLQKSLDDYKDN